MEKQPNRRPIIVHRKHCEPASTFDGDPEEAVLYQRRDAKRSMEVEHPDIKNKKKESVACEIDVTKQEIMIKRKVETSPNQFDSFGGKIRKRNT